MSDDWRRPKEIVLYEKDPTTKIATITLNRPERLNAPTIAAQQRYADLVHRANVDDDVKVLVIRGDGEDWAAAPTCPSSWRRRLRRRRPRCWPSSASARTTTSSIRPKGSYRYGATVSQLLHRPAARGMPQPAGLQEDRILEVKGYCYGWHFYQAADADIVISSDDALFGHAAFRYAGWAPRMWRWAQMMGLRKFMEMVFTGRPFTAAEMYDCDFVNAVVPRDQLEAETTKYALACSRTRPTDTVVHAEDLLRDLQAAPGRVHGQPARRCARVDRRWRPARRQTIWSLSDAIDAG